MADRTPFEINRWNWKRENWGIMTTIARELGYSKGYVSLVFLGKKHSWKGDIEQSLIAAGAPGVKRRARAK